jgi:hypothetical protein
MLIINSCWEEDRIKTGPDGPVQSSPETKESSLAEQGDTAGMYTDADHAQQTKLSQ